MHIYKNVVNSNRIATQLCSMLCLLEPPVQPYKIKTITNQINQQKYTQLCTLYLRAALQAHHELAVKYIPAAVVKLSAHGKYMDNILQPHNTPSSLHQMKQVLWASQGAIYTGKLLALKWWAWAWVNTGCLRYHCLRLIYTPSSI